MKRIILGVGYPCFHVSGFSISILRPGKKPFYWPPVQVELNRSINGAKKIRLVAEVLE